MNIQELYQELIIDHGTNPRNHYCPKNYTNKADAINSLCGDKLHVFLTLENDKITEISFTGTGCAISVASASIMTETLKGKTIDDAKAMFLEFQNILEINVERDAEKETTKEKMKERTTEEKPEETTKETTEEKTKETTKQENVPAPNLNKLKALAGVKQYPNRIKCATLAWHGLEAAIKTPENPKT